MRLAVKILFAIFLITGAGGYYLTFGMLDNIRIRYLEGVEETLVDQAGILAGFVAQDIENNNFSPQAFHHIFDTAYARQFSSQIYHLRKIGVDLRVYITDAKGIIVFDSARKATVGEDYSNWRDVFLTLRGEYGARSSRDDAKDQSSSVLYVAAPILVHGNIKGVLTVAKPTTNINSFLIVARSRIKLRSIFTAGCIIVLSILVIVVITRPVKLLTQYAEDISSGRKAVLPSLDKTEIGDMGRAFEDMRVALENRKYVEKYVQALTHEIKSPLAAIKGAAELLEEEMPEKQKARFLSNIRSESERIKQLVDRLVKLSSIENMAALENAGQLVFSDLLNEVLVQMQPVLEGKKLSLRKEGNDNVMVRCNPFLLKLALSNLIQNAIDFSPESSEIKTRSSVMEGMFSFELIDQGPGIPEYARERVFEKFFSLQRPDSGKKSTGLGLNFVKEVAALHRGEITLDNYPSGGGRAVFSIPAS